jgi:hypothetical protein
LATAKKHTPLGLKQDRGKVNASQPYEVAYVAKMTGAPKVAVKAASKAVGPSRKAIEKASKK